MNAPQFQRAMPVLEVTDRARSLAFYRDRLGFSAVVGSEPPSFAILQRGTVTIALDASERGHSANNQYWAAYLYVADVNALYDEFRDLGDAPFGCREFDVTDPDGFPPGLDPDGRRDTLSGNNSA